MSDEDLERIANQIERCYQSEQRDLPELTQRFDLDDAREMLDYIVAMRIRVQQDDAAAQARLVHLADLDCRCPLPVTSPPE
jgi:hypothetical protein